MADRVIAELSARAGKALASRGWIAAVAESCTGGGVGAALTETPGASAWFAGGIVAYADAAKIGILRVPASLVAERGAVSREVAGAMAEGVRRLFGADVAVATTGIAGPGGGTPEKPVGTVCLAVSAEGILRTECIRFPGDRESVRRQTVVRALEILAGIPAERG